MYVGIIMLIIIACNLAILTRMLMLYGLGQDKEEFYVEQLKKFYNVPLSNYWERTDGAAV